MKYYYWIALFVFAVDLITKKIIVSTLAVGDTIHVIGKRFFSITSIRNRGAAFGLLHDQRILLLSIKLVVISLIVWYLYKNRQSGKVLLQIGLGMVLGGALGNLLDRALYGEITDFLQFMFGNYVFPSFNAADTGICCGVVLIVIHTLFFHEERQRRRPDALGKEI